MLSRIKWSPRRYAIIAGVVLLIIAGYVLQAWTTIEVKDDGITITCWHAHFRDHGKSRRRAVAQDSHRTTADSILGASERRSRAMI